MFNKILGSKGQDVAVSIANAVRKELPVYRFDGGWSTMGAQVRPQDTRTPAQIDATIDALAERIPAVKEFKADLKRMNPAHKALASDTIELASRYEFLMTPVDMVGYKAADGKSIIQVLLPKLLKASKENPEALKFAQAVINNTDTQTSKYVLAQFAGFSPESMLARKDALDRISRYEANMLSLKGDKYTEYITRRTKELEENKQTFIDAITHYEADILGIKNLQDYQNYIAKRSEELKKANFVNNTYKEETAIDIAENGQRFGMSIPFIRPVAESTINGMYLGTFEKQENFLRTMDELLKPSATPEKLAALRSYNSQMSQVTENNRLDVGTIRAFVETSTPLTQLRMNIATLPEAMCAARAKGERFNPIEYVMKNVNFAKAPQQTETKPAPQIFLEV